MEADTDRDGKISFDEFKKMVENTDVSNSMTLGKLYFRVYRYNIAVKAPSCAPCAELSTKRAPLTKACRSILANASRNGFLLSSPSGSMYVR